MMIERVWDGNKTENDQNYHSFLIKYRFVAILKGESELTQPTL